MAEPIRSNAALRTDALGQLNAVILSASQFQAALEVLAMLAHRAQADRQAHALALQAYVRDAALPDDTIIAAALHARITALSKWTRANDPDRQSDAEAVIEAAARFPLSDLADGIGFEPAAFQEMILFIEDVPW